jgi:hypothetical protein
MKEYHRWLRNATVKTVIPHITSLHSFVTASYFKYAKPNPSLTAACIYVSNTMTRAKRQSASGASTRAQVFAWR